MISADSTVVNHYVYNMKKYRILHKIKTVSRINTVEGAFSYESDISYMRNTADLPQAHKATAFHWKNKKKYYLGTKIISYTIQITIDIWHEFNVSSWTIIKTIYPQQ